MVERNMMMNPQNIGTSYPILKRIKNIIESYVSMYSLFLARVSLYDPTALNYLFVNGPTNGFVISWTTALEANITPTSMFS